MWVNYQNGEKPSGVLLYVPMIPPRGGDIGGRLEMGLCPGYKLLSTLHDLCHLNTQLP